VAGCAAVYDTGVSIQPAALVEKADGQLGPGSIASMPLGREYQINPGDQLSIRFPRRPAYSDTYLVRADGRITVPLIGSVEAATRTPDALQAELISRYRQIMAALPPAQERTYVLQSDDVLDIRFSYFPESNTVVSVRADGRISMPMIGEVLAEGLTPNQLQSRLVQLYTKRIPNPDLVVIVKEARSNVYVHAGEVRLLPDPGLVDLTVNVTRTAPLVVYVGGEVPAPGLQSFIPGTNTLQVIYAAGGPAPTGDMRSVVILRRGADDSVVRIVADLTQDLAGKGTSSAVVQPFDVVVVPRSNIAQVGDALDQYLYRILRPLANSSFGYYFTKQVGTTRQETVIQNNPGTVP
jgi:polysaccharide export outer membrane protein